MSERRQLAGLLALDDRAALVTGGGGGIGRAVAELFLAAGADVVSLDLPGRESAPGAVNIACDVRDGAQIGEAVQAVGSRFDRLDVVVHCAGVTRDAVLWKMTDEMWSDVLRVNLESAFRVLREAVPMMRAAGKGGSIVLVASINGERGKFGQANYAASKAGLIGLARTEARELGRFGIRVNVVSPGLIDTAMTAGLPEEMRRAAIEESPLGLAGKPEDVARAALFLASPMSGHVTGQVLRVDGGQLIA